MLRRTLKKLRSIRSAQLLGRDFCKYVDHDRRVHCEAPYSLGIYRDLLHSFTENPDTSVRDYLSSSGDRGSINVYARHDIDTQRCIDNMPGMLDLDLEFRVRTGVYFLVHDEYYDLARYKHEVCEYRDAGLEIGLHTQCYVDDDPVQYFRQETDRFEEILGFAPRSFTIHGLGEYRLEVRKRFCEMIAREFRSFGYAFSDAIKAHRHYHYVIEDCHKSSETGNRFIYDDFVRFPTSLRKSRNVLILTHPCYWTASVSG